MVPRFLFPAMWCFWLVDVAEAPPNHAVCGLLDVPLMRIDAPAQKPPDESEQWANSVMLAHNSLLHGNADVMGASGNPVIIGTDDDGDCPAGGQSGSGPKASWCAVDRAFRAPTSEVDARDQFIDAASQSFASEQLALELELRPLAKSDFGALGCSKNLNSYDGLIRFWGST